VSIHCRGCAILLLPERVDLDAEHTGNVANSKTRDDKLDVSNVELIVVEELVQLRSLVSLIFRTSPLSLMSTT
jgi:hypothetical protein